MPTWLSIRKLGNAIRSLAAQALFNQKVFWLVELVAFITFVVIYTWQYWHEQPTAIGDWFFDYAGLAKIFGASAGMAALFGGVFEVALFMVLLVPMMIGWIEKRERERIARLAKENGIMTPEWERLLEKDSNGSTSDGKR